MPEIEAKPFPSKGNGYLLYLIGKKFLQNIRLFMAVAISVSLVIEFILWVAIIIKIFVENSTYFKEIRYRIL